MPLPEKALIERIRHRVRGGGVRIVQGIGDDCAVLRLPAGHEALVTTDFSLEGTHFRREWHPPESVGHRCLTRGLSDIAAMGGEPLAVFLSLALPEKLPQSWADRFLNGLLGLADKIGVPIAGGDTAQSQSGILADIVAIGSVARGKAVGRKGASPGDRIFVTGMLGGSAAALGELMSGRKKSLRPRDYVQHFYPLPRVDVGRALREKNLVSAMIDISDGLSTDLAHICEESGVGAEIQKDAIPLASVGKPSHDVNLRHALHGGDDYELLFTVRRGKRVPARIRGVPITQIGYVTHRRHMVLMNQDGAGFEFKAEGWEHFGG